MPEPRQAPLLELEKRDLTPEGLWQAAQDANIALKAAELEYLKDEDWLRDQRRRLARLETNTTIRVAAEKVEPNNPESKHRFTNDTQRKAEVDRRLENDPAHREMATALVVAEGNQAVRKIEIDHLGRTYTLAKLRYEALMIGKRYEH